MTACELRKSQKTFTLPIARLFIGFALAALIGYAGFRRRALSKSGVIGAILTGGIIFGFGGLSGAALLLVFFISSSALSRFKESQKESQKSLLTLYLLYAIN